tara:strand:+ start:332 stop:547 length:216 start_codon:yes stop_codon:yes gene_type:complete
MTVRSNHNSLLNYFLYDKKDLSPAYVRKCEEFIDSLGSAKLADCFKMEKPQATSSPQSDVKKKKKDNYENN